MTDDDAIVVEITYPHPIERVWRALTSSDALAVWLMPNDFEPRLGHAFTFRTAPDHRWSGVVHCRVAALEPPHRVAYTWQGAGSDLPETLVTFTLAPTAEGTHLRLEHTGFASGGPRSLTVRDILASGWNSKIMRERLPALLDAWAAQEHEIEIPEQEKGTTI
jgi:uncharacterized protein YndB with AHSA1/START domain